MNSSELTQLQLLLDQLVRVRDVRKDPQADDLVQRAVQLQPDAAYLLVQRILLLEQAMDHLKSQLSRPAPDGNGNPAAMNQAGNPSGSDTNGSHTRPAAGLGGGVGYALPGSAGGPSAGPIPGAPQAMSPALQNPAPVAPAASAGWGNSGGSWLRNAAAAAAGVAGGAFLFQGIESLLGHHGGLGGMGSSGGFNSLSGQPGVVENSVVNNYYQDGGRDDSPNRDGGGDSNDFQRFDEPAPADDSSFDDQSWDDSSSI